MAGAFFGQRSQASRQPKLRADHAPTDARNSTSTWPITRRLDIEDWTWAAWTNQFNDVQVDISGQLQGLFGFTVAGPSFDEDGRDAGVGLKWTAAPGVTTMATVVARFGSDLEPDVFGRIGASIQLGQLD